MNTEAEKNSTKLSFSPHVHTCSQHAYVTHIMMMVMKVVLLIIIIIIIVTVIIIIILSACWLNFFKSMSFAVVWQAWLLIGHLRMLGNPHVVWLSPHLTVSAASNLFNPQTLHTNLRKFQAGCHQAEPLREKESRTLLSCPGLEEILSKSPDGWCPGSWPRKSDSS